MRRRKHRAATSGEWVHKEGAVQTRQDRLSGAGGISP
jgi:hypothetical protein